MNNSVLYKKYIAVNNYFINISYNFSLDLLKKTI